MKKITPMFSDHEVIKAAKEEAEKVSAHEREQQRKLASTIPESEMPCPRLELRWVKTDHDLRCDYNIVIPIDSNDIRRDAAVRFGSELRFCTGWTTSSSDRSPLLSNGVIDVPYRDGKHAAWDSYRINFPAFTVWQGQAQSVLPEEPRGEPVQDPKMHEENHRDWATRHYFYFIKDLKNQIRKFAHRVLRLRDGHRKQSWPWLFFNQMYDHLMEKINNLGDDFGHDFIGWMIECAPKIKADMIKHVCAECGAEVPDNLTQACEHIFEPEARAFLEKELPPK